MSRVEITQKALRHGQTVMAGGLLYRVEWELDNTLSLVRVSDNVAVATASGQNQLRAKIEAMEASA